MNEILQLDILNFTFLNQVAVLLINFIGILLIVAIVGHNSFRDKTTSVFITMSILMFIWINFASFARLIGISSLFWSEVFLRIAWVATPPFFAYVYLMAVNILRKEQQLKTLNISLVLLSLVLSLVTAFTSYVIKGVEVTESNLGIIYGDGLYVFLGLISIYIIATLFVVLKTKVEEYRRKRVHIFLAGIIIFYVANLIFNISLPIFFGITHLYYFGDYSLIFIVGFTAYAILWHQLMDIKTMVLRSVVFSGLVATFFVACGVMIYALIKYIHQFSNITPFYHSLIGVVGIAVAIPAYRHYRLWLRKATDKFLYQHQADYNQALVKIGEELSGTINIFDVTSTVLHSIKSVIRVKKVAIILKNSQTGMYLPYAKDGMEDFLATIQPDNILIKYLKSTKKILVRNELLVAKENANSEDKIKEISVLEDALNWMDVSVVVPLVVKNEFTGMIIIGDKISGESYSDEDIEFMAAFAPEAATALENAQLYKESLEFGQKLENEVKKATKELQVANIQLRDLDKAKSEFLSIASHQLYTPLTALRGYISMLMEGDFGKVNEQQKPILEILEKSSNRLIELIKNLLDISRIESGRLELNLQSVDLVELARELVQDLMPNAMSKNLKMKFNEPKKKLPHAVVDEQRLRQVMLNFIDNAIKYTSKGSVNVYVEQKGDELVFSVVDTGKGITHEEIAKLFNKFSRVGGSARFNTEGTGLGLYVAKQIVKEHRGDLYVESPGENQGSTFIMRLPMEGTDRSLHVGEQASVVIKAAEATGESYEK